MCQHMVQMKKSLGQGQINMKNDPDDSESESSSARDFGDLRRAVVATFSSSLARVAARILLIIFVVKLYGVGNFGYLGEAAAVVELLAALATLGLPKTIMAYFDRHKFDERASAELVVNALCLTALMGGTLSILLGVLWPYLFSAESALPLYTAAAIFIISMTEIMLTLTRSRRIIRWEALVKGLVKPWSFFVLAMAGYFTFVQNDSYSPMTVLITAYLLSLLMSAFVAFIGFGQLIKDDLIRVGKINITSTFALGKESAPIGIVDVATFGFRRIDIVILGYFTSSDVTGVYYLGQQLGTVIEKFRHLFEPMASPILAQTQSTQTIGEYLQKTCRWVFAASLGASLSFVIFAVPNMGLFDVSFAGAGLLMALLLLGEISDGSTGLAELPIIFRNPLTASRNVIIVIIAEIIAVYICASHYGIYGAAAGFAFAMILLALLRLWSVRKLYGVQIINITYLKPIGAAIIAAIPALLTRDYFLSFGAIGFIVGVVGCSLIYLLTLKFMGLSMKISDNS